MRFDIFTLFPAMFEGPFSDSIIARALSAGIIQVQTHNVRDFAEGKHQVTDDYPYGGGGGMVMKPDPIFRAVEAALEMSARQAGADQGDMAQATEEEPLFISTPAPCPIILLSPQGRPFDQRVAAELAGHERLALICGRYEGVDERVRLHLATDEISIGDYVLSGGELAAMVIVDAVTRLLPGALGFEAAPAQDSHATGLLEYPHFTRPPSFRGYHVPEILLSGHHGRVAQWRRHESLRRTLARRPDLLARAVLGKKDLVFLRTLGWEKP
ncbi:MAG: tRNA (guanosine(37)-N1)-methyltransferase TrmD [Anaerolineae bacterium]